MVFVVSGLVPEQVEVNAMEQVVAPFLALTANGLKDPTRIDDAATHYNGLVHDNEKYAGQPMAALLHSLAIQDLMEGDAPLDLSTPRLTLSTAQAWLVGLNLGLATIRYTGVLPSTDGPSIEQTIEFIDGIGTLPKDEIARTPRCVQGQIDNLALNLFPNTTIHRGPNPPYTCLVRQFLVARAAMRFSAQATPE